MPYLHKTAVVEDNKDPQDAKLKQWFGAVRIDYKSSVQLPSTASFRIDYKSSVQLPSTVVEHIDGLEVEELPLLRRERR